MQNQPITSFNAYQITQLDAEISNLKTKTDLQFYISHIHEAHLHLLDQKIERTNQILANILETSFWFSSKGTNTIEKKFQSEIHHHKNTVKPAQHHQLAHGTFPCDIWDGILNDTLDIAEKKNLVSFVNFPLDLFQIEALHLCTQAMKQFTLILHISMVSNTNLLYCYEFLPLPIHFNFSANISITPDICSTNLLGIGHPKSF